MLVITTSTNAYSIPKTIMGSNNIDPNDPKNYLSMEGINRLDAEFRKYSIDFKDRIPVLFRELSLLEFYLWTPLVVNNNAEQQQPWIFNASVSPQELINHGFLKNRETKFISHGWNSDAVKFADIFRIGNILLNKHTPTLIIKLLVGISATMCHSAEKIPAKEGCQYKRVST